jgi:hypothetical protein
MKKIITIAEKANAQILFEYFKRFNYDSLDFVIMTRTQSRIKLSLLLGTIIALGVLSLAVNNIPVQALHKEEQKLDKFDNLKEFADAVKKGDANIEKIPLLSMKASNIYDDANKQTQDCINQAAKIGKSLVAKEVVHCVDDVNFFNTKISNSSVPTTTTSAITATSADTGTGGTSTSDTSTPTSDTSTPTSDTSTPTSDTSTPTSDTSTSSSGNVKENNMINELVKTGKFTEAEAKDFVSKTTQNGADGGSTSDSPKTTNADTSTSDTQASDNTQSSSNQDNNANTQSSSNQDNNANTQSSSNQDNNANTQSSSNQDNNTQSSSNQDNNTQSSNANSNKAIDYNDLKDLVHSIKNHVVDSDDITLNAFQDSGAYKGADEATQKCIDLAGKIGNKLGDQEIVHCSEDPNFYQNQISSNNNNANANANDNNANNSNSNSNSNSNDNNSGGTGN